MAWLRSSRLKSCFQHWRKCIFQARRLCWLIFGCTYGKTGTLMQGQKNSGTPQVVSVYACLFLFGFELFIVPPLHKSLVRFSAYTCFRLGLES